MIQLELLNRPTRPPQLTPERLGLLDSGRINPSLPLFEALADSRGLRFGGVTAPPMNWERLLSLPEAPPKPVISIALPDRPRPLITEFDLSKSYPAHFLMNRILDSAANRISYREQAQARAMEAVPMLYFEPPEIQQLTAARQALQEAIAVPAAQPLPEVLPQTSPVPMGNESLWDRFRSHPGVVTNTIYLIANGAVQIANGIVQDKFPNLNVVIPIYFGVHLAAMAYLGYGTYKAILKDTNNTQLAVNATSRAITHYAVAGGTWNTLSVLTQR